MVSFIRLVVLTPPNKMVWLRENIFIYSMLLVHCYSTCRYQNIFRVMLFLLLVILLIVCLLISWIISPLFLFYILLVLLSHLLLVCVVVLPLFKFLILVEINYLLGIVSVFSLDTLVIRRAIIVIFLSFIAPLWVLILPFLSPLHFFSLPGRSMSSNHISSRMEISFPSLTLPLPLSSPTPPGSLNSHFNPPLQVYQWARDRRVVSYGPNATSSSFEVPAPSVPIPKTDNLRIALR